MAAAASSGQEEEPQPRPVVSGLAAVLSSFVATYLSLSALRECRQVSHAWRQFGYGSCSAPAELWRCGLDGAHRAAAWKAILLDGLSIQAGSWLDSYDSLCREPCSYDDVIGRDVGRTLPKEELFREKNGPGQGALFRLLHALAVRLWDIGYVQSLNFVVATLIGVFPDDEAMVFHCAQALLFRHSLADFYRPRFPKLGVTVWQFDRIVEGFLPVTHAALVCHGITAEYYAMQWFLTLFASDLPQPVVRRVWDRFLVAGWRIIVQVGLALLAQVQDELLALDMCEAMTFLKRFVRMRHLEPEALLAEAEAFAVSHQMLSELEAAYNCDHGLDAKLCVQNVSHEVTVDPSSPAAEKKWAVSRGATLARGSKQLVSSPQVALPRAFSGREATGGTPMRGCTVLPFLIHNLDTGETTLMEEAWNEFRDKPPASGVHGEFRRAPPATEATRQRCGGSFWVESRQRQAMRRLGKAS